METGAYDPQWPYVHMQPTETVQAHQDLRGRWLLPIHNGTFDLAMHAWDDPFQQVVALAAPRGIQVTTPMMGERIDIAAPHAGQRWWRQRMPRAPASNRAWAIRAPSAPLPRATRTATPWRSAPSGQELPVSRVVGFRNGRSPVAPGRRPAPSHPPAAPGCRPGPS